MAYWNENLFPPGGFEFVDAEAISHVGGSLSDLISKLAAYRTRRGLPQGNPIAEVNDYLCARFPSRCFNDAAPSAGAVTTSGPAPATRITEWLRGMWMKVAAKTIGFVDEAEVKRRAAICVTCPLYANFPTNCAACSETFNQLSFQLRAGRDKQSSSLKMCGSFFTDLRVDVLAVQPPQPEAPENCWKRG